MFKTACLIALALTIQGCAGAWIAQPSATTKNLVNDLRLDGFECDVDGGEIVCLQTEPHRNKQPARCDSKRGCQHISDKLLFNRYRITQDSHGMPGIKHDVVEKTAPRA